MKKNRLTVSIVLIALIGFSTSCAQKNLACSIDCKEKNEQTKINEEKSVMENSSIDNQSEQLVCKLIGAEKMEKKELLKTAIFSQVKGIDELENGYNLKFEDKNDILLKLTDYLMIEKECCPFFNFDLSILPNAKGISLKITGQEGAKDMLKPLIDEIGII